MSKHPKHNVGKASSKGIPMPASHLSEKKKKKSKFVSTCGSFNKTRLKAHIKRFVKTCDRFQGTENVPQFGDPSLDCLADIVETVSSTLVSGALELAKKISKNTIGDSEITSSASLMLTGDLKGHCLEEIRKVLKKSETSRKSD